MNVNLRIIFSSFILITVTISTPVYADPQFTMQQEMEANPNLTKALNEMKSALKELEATPNEFGGNKSKAISDLRSAIDWTTKALYYRLREDDDRLDGSMINNR